MSAGRSPHEHDAPFAEGDVLPTGRRECEESPVRTPERREVDATTINPRTPLRIRPEVVDLARQVKRAVADEETSYPRHSPASSCSRAASENDRVADVEELEVGRCCRALGEPHTSESIAGPEAACFCALGCRHKNGCDDDGHRRSACHSESVGANAPPVKHCCGQLTSGREERGCSPACAVVLASPGDELVNLESTSTLAHGSVHWHAITVSNQLWLHLPPVGVSSLHGKEGVDGSSPSEGLNEAPARRALSLPEKETFWSDGVHDTSTAPNVGASVFARAVLLCGFARSAATSTWRPRGEMSWRPPPQKNLAVRLVDRSLQFRDDRRQIAVGRAHRRLGRRGAAAQRGYGERCDHEQRERRWQPDLIGEKTD